jgi:hypothetical protein
MCGEMTCARMLRLRTELPAERLPRLIYRIVDEVLPALDGEFAKIYTENVTRSAQRRS